MKDQAEIFEALKAILVDVFEVDGASITLESRLYEELDLDSIDAVDLVIKLQDLTGKKIKPEEFKQVRTVGDAVRAVSDLM